VAFEASEPEPPGMEKLVELKTLCRFSDPHLSHFISIFSSLLLNRISFFSLQSAHWNSYIGMGFSFWLILFKQVIEKRHERSQDRAKFGKKWSLCI